MTSGTTTSGGGGAGTSGLSGKSNHNSNNARSNNRVNETIKSLITGAQQQNHVAASREIIGQDLMKDHMGGDISNQFNTF